MGCCQSVNQQRSPLHLAAMEGSEAVEALVAAGANLEAQDEDHCTPLHLAAGMGKEAAVQALVAAGANLEAQDKYQRTPLHLAAEEGKEAAVRALVAAGANLEAQDEDHCTPLHLAAWEGMEAAVPALVAAGANLEAQDKDKSTPLHLAARKGKEDAVRALVAAGANLEARDKNQYTPLHLAAGKGKEDAVRALVAAGANLEAQDKDQRTPLHLAAGEGKEDAVRALVAAGANLEAQGQHQRSTPLHLAAGKGEEAAVRALVAAGANLEAQNEDQDTPLHFAAGTGKEATVRALVAAGANLEAQAKDQDTPLQLAELKKQESAVEALKQAASARLAAQHQDQAPLAAFLKALDLESHAAGIWASAGIAEPSDFSLLTEGGWAALQEATSLSNIQLKKLKRCAASNTAGPATAPSSNLCHPSLEAALPDFLASLRLGAFAGRIRHALGVAHASDLAFWAREADWEGLRPFMKEVQVAKLRKAINSRHSSSIEEEAEKFVAGLLLSARVSPCSPVVDFLGCLGLCQYGGRMKELLGVFRAEDLTLADASEWAALRNFMTQIEVAKLELALQCLMKNEGNNETTNDAAPPADVPLSEYLQTIGLPPNLSVGIQRTIRASQAEDLALADDGDWTTLRSIMTRIQVEKLQLAVQGRTVSSSYGGFRNRQGEGGKTENCALKENDRPAKAGNYDSCENKLCKDRGTTEVKQVQEESKNSCRPCTPADAEPTGKGHQVLAEAKTDNKNSTLYQYTTTQPSALGVPPEEKNPRDGETTQPSAPGLLLAEEKDPRDGEEGNLCCVCLDRPKTIVLLPCRHMCLCSECAAKMTLCPLCQEEISQRIQAFT